MLADRVDTKLCDRVYLLKTVFNLVLWQGDRLFSIESQDGLIFIRGFEKQMLFVVEHSSNLWQSLLCRMLKNNIVELTNSELEELYGKKLQEFEA